MCSLITHNPSQTPPGEIDPARISISGGLHHQNNFQLDGFNINADLDPSTDLRDQRRPDIMPGGRSQGLNVDTSLLESIVVMDSNIGAAYGGFTGGVVQANIRKPRTDRWHFDLSYQYTSDKLTKQHIDESLLADTENNNNFEKSAIEYAQPKFTKQAYRFNFEGYATEKLGLIGGISIVDSVIPLYAYQNPSDTESATKRNQRRRNDNYFLKANYNFSDRFTLEANVAYMPSYSELFYYATKDSFYTYDEGGWQTGLKGIWDTDLGLWTNQLGFSSLQHSRNTDVNYYVVFNRSDEFNLLSTNRLEIGTPPALEQLQRTYSYKSDMEFKPVELLVEHKFKVGGEVGYQNIRKQLKRDFYQNPTYYGGPFLENLNGVPCDYTYNFLDVPLCSSATTYQGWQGQYITTLFVGRKDAPENNVKFNVLSYALYAEDDMKILDSKSIGLLNARLGVRFDGDNYMSKKSIAPRFSLAYTLPQWNSLSNTTFTFGANRYYARNLFNYKLVEASYYFTGKLTRADINSPWVEEAYSEDPTYKFSKLKIPYSDELMVGVSQDIGIVNLNLKYINRQGKDEIFYKGTQPREYTNEGKSTSNIISLSVQNTTPIKTFNVYHHYLLAFDWTQVKRSYDIYANFLSNNYDNYYAENPDIFYDGKVIKFRDRPLDNYARPWTLRLNTTHSWQFKQVNLSWNNFFRYRSGYDRIVQLQCSTGGRFGNYCSPNWNADIGITMNQYGKYHFKGTFSWDMRVGVDFRVDTLLAKEYDAGRLYVNVDIINVLNSKNATTIGSSSLLGAVTTSIPSARYTIPIYEIGRQFWLQVGYKY